MITTPESASFSLFPLPQNPQNKSAEVVPKVTETENQEENQNNQTTNSTEVYYDSRSGNRYLLNNGKREKLADSGVVSINQITRPETTNKARSTFFAAHSNK